MDKLIETLRAESLLSKEYEWNKWTESIPYIKFPSDWEVKAIPPFNGAIIRYHIKTPNHNQVSVYLDCYDRLASVGEPYWESYDGMNIDRFLMADTEGLVNCISKYTDKEEE